MLDVDIIFPNDVEFKNTYNDLPLCPEKKIVKNRHISPHSLELKKKFKIKNDNSPKLIADFAPKENYICHITTLLTYLRLGAEITKLHRGVSFTQKPFIKQYVDKMSQLRKNTNSIFLKSLYKLALNSSF